MYTKGPWRVGDAGGTVFGPKTDRPAPVTICTVSRSPIIGAESKGNARLIAQAPTLLEVCKSIRAALNCNYDSKTIEYELGNVLDDAIAKAEGER